MLIDCGIYSITNKVNGKEYIGSSREIPKRWGSHKYGLRANRHHSNKLQRSWNKYGEDCFVFSIVELCSINDLVVREQHHIDKRSPFFNIRPVVGSNLGLPHTDETKDKIRESNKGQKRSPESRARMSKACMGRVHSEETKYKMSMSSKGKPKSDSHKISLAVKKAALSERVVREIRRLRDSGVTGVEVSKLTGVGTNVISLIYQRKSYKWVPE